MLRGGALPSGCALGLRSCTHHSLATRVVIPHGYRDCAATFCCARRSSLVSRAVIGDTDADAPKRP
jgi:hypothetical protein